MFVRRRDIWAIRFDLDGLEVIEDPLLIEEGVRGEQGGAIQMAVATDGRLLYIPGTHVQEQRNTDCGAP